jgi:glycosyltransferase involved in cell wall biosynthesis
MPRSKLFAFAQKMKLARVLTRPAIFVVRSLIQIKKYFSRTIKIPLMKVSERTESKQLFVDITCLIDRDHGGGIQRVQKSLLNALLENATENKSVRPIFFSKELQRFEYVSSDRFGFLGGNRYGFKSGEVIASPGDIFLNTDLNYQFTINQESFYSHLRKNKIKVFFIVYDILPLTMPKNFPPGIADLHRKWLEIAARQSHLLCISKTVEQSIQSHFSKSDTDLKSSVIRLGNFLPPEIIGKKKRYQVDGPEKDLKFLVVSTLEPRKNHAQILEAFEILWAKGMTPQLVFVGKKGWDVERLVKNLKHHPELNKKLFWYENASDEDLSRIYLETTALISASQDEGFGLPILEAASVNIPLILRNIPVFQEVAGSNAWYFEGDTGSELAVSINAWIQVYRTGRLSLENEIEIPNWRDTADDIFRVFESHL